ncbi:hypothetical protein AK812_SmicGene28010 [Symbiodinium microadriaticum]|uniref:Uncharacterized protein n=1 Tax=Symbiodinium microadriaticum TaxID=2951 RepID=A0A1Q9D5D4_SYMMI|nr:hypothetical protein AK812_SmicGene28010 [Symbiodinium microadriaticum]
MEPNWSIRPIPTTARRAAASLEPAISKPWLGPSVLGTSAVLVFTRHLSCTTGRLPKVLLRAIRRASRKGFKVNTKYKGAVSYGTVSQEELEEAARIRSEYNAERPQQAQSALPAAKKRLLLKRLQQPGQVDVSQGL